MVCSCPSAPNTVASTTPTNHAAVSSSRLAVSVQSGNVDRDKQEQAAQRRSARLRYSPVQSQNSSPRKSRKNDRLHHDPASSTCLVQPSGPLSVGPSPKQRHPAFTEDKTAVQRLKVPKQAVTSQNVLGARPVRADSKSAHTDGKAGHRHPVSAKTQRGTIAAERTRVRGAAASPGGREVSARRVRSKSTARASKSSRRTLGGRAPLSEQQTRRTGRTPKQVVHASVADAVHQKDVASSGISPAEYAILGSAVREIVAQQEHTSADIFQAGRHSSKQDALPRTSAGGDSLPRFAMVPTAVNRLPADVGAGTLSEPIPDIAAHCADFGSGPLRLFCTLAPCCQQKGRSGAHVSALLCSH